MNNDASSPVKKLDNVLKILAEASEGEINSEVPISISKLNVVEITKFYRNTYHADLNALDCDLIIDKLLLDKLIFKEHYDVSTFPRFCVNYNGYIFNLDGGYEGRLKRDAAESIRVDKIEKNQKFHRVALTWLTVIVAVGTLVAATYYLLEILNHWYHIYPVAHH